MIIPHKLVEAIDNSWNDDEESRGYLGASSLGKKCSRELWYGFRWVADSDFPSRVLRLFHRGHREEETFELILQKASIPYFPHDPATGEQFKVRFRNKHVGGHSDGRGEGLPDLPPGTKFLGEFKTHNDKSFKHLVKNGVQESKPVHYTQMQLYMHRLELPWALYGAVNKNDDHLHWELVEYDPEHATYYEDRADLIVAARTPPPKISVNPGWYECSFCDYKPVCHKGAPVLETCRSCVHVHPIHNGEWWCGLHDRVLEVEDQRVGCQEHVLFNNEEEVF